MIFSFANLAIADKYAKSACIIQKCGIIGVERYAL